MYHTSDTGSQLNKYPVRSNVLYYTCMTASFWKLNFNIRPWICRKLLDRQAHLSVLFIQSYHFCFMLVAQFEEFLCIDRSISPCDLRYVDKAFNTWHNFQECTVVFNIHYSA